MSRFSDEVSAGARFEFGRNWQKLIPLLDEQRIQIAESSVKELLGRQSLAGLTFCDVGCGSGLFSLVAHRLDARVLSFDYDPQSVNCTLSLKAQVGADDNRWRVQQGSVLDRDFLRTLGTFDVVYSWGVLHHTGSMFQAFENVCDLVRPGGLLAIAIYNDQGRPSVRWLQVKKIYNGCPRMLRWLVLALAGIRLWGPTTVRDLLRGRPGLTWRTYRSARGMSAWRDLVDWVGGLPFEVAKPEVVFRFFKARGFEIVDLTTNAGGLACNEYVFRRLNTSQSDSSRPT